MLLSEDFTSWVGERRLEDRKSMSDGIGSDRHASDRLRENDGSVSADDVLRLCRALTGIVTTDPMAAFFQNAPSGNRCPIVLKMSELLAA